MVKNTSGMVLSGWRSRGAWVSSLASKHHFFVRITARDSFFAVIDGLVVDCLVLDRGRAFRPNVGTCFAIDQEGENVGPGVVADAIEHALSFCDQCRIEFGHGNSFTLGDWLAERDAFRRNDRRIASAA
jgi:hypothetical protein